MGREPPAMVTTEKVMEALRDVIDPEIGVNIVDLGMVRSLDVQGDIVKVNIALTVPDCPLSAKIKDDVTKAAHGVHGVKEVSVVLSAMTMEERENVFQKLGNSSPAERSGVQQNTISGQHGIGRLPKGSIRQIIAIASGKGGVGKSFVTAMLGVELRRRGFSVGILDADLTGSSIARILGVKDPPKRAQSGIAPPTTRTGIKLVSMNLLMDRDDAALIWRGPMINSAIRQLYTDLEWGTLDYLLIDLPPGTSDAPLTVFQSLPLDAVLIVSSPQDLAVMIVGKAINMAGIMRVPILGLIENMSYLTCPDCGKRIGLFGRSKGQEASAAAKIEFLGSIPMDPLVSRLCDEGRIEEYKSAEFGSVTQKVIEGMKPLSVPQELRHVEDLKGKERGR